MKRALYLICLLAVATPAHAGFLGFSWRRPKAQSMPASASEACKRQMGIVAQVAPPQHPSGSEQFYHATAFLNRFNLSLIDSARNTRAGDGLVPASAAAPAPEQPFVDGTKWSARGGTSEAPFSEASRAQLQARVEKWKEAIENRALYDTRYAVLTDPHRILELLRTRNSIPDKEEIDRRSFMVGATVAGIEVALSTSIIFGKMVSGKANGDKQLTKIVDEIRATLVTTRERHLALVRDALEARIPPMQREAIDRWIGEHVRWLNKREQEGKPVKFGARGPAYDRLRKYSLHLETANELADQDPSKVTVAKLDELVKQVRDHQRINESDGFTDDEVTQALKIRNAEFFNTSAGPLSMFFPILGGPVLGGLAGLYYNENTRNRLGLLAGRKGLHPDLAEIEKLVADAIRPSGGTDKQSDWIWLGGAADGRQTDFLLHIDRSSNPPTVQLLVGSRSEKPVLETTVKPVAEQWKPAAEPVAPLISLSELYQKVQIEKFPTVIGDELAPLTKVFADARALKLSDFEQRRFQNAVNELKKIQDVPQLDRLLAVFRAERGSRR